MTEEQQAASIEQVYTVGDLKENSKVLFDVYPEVIDGALHENNKAQFSVAEMQGLIKTFLNKKVEVE